MYVGSNQDSDEEREGNGQASTSARNVLSVVNSRDSSNSGRCENQDASFAIDRDGKMLSEYFAVRIKLNSTTPPPASEACRPSSPS